MLITRRYYMEKGPENNLFEHLLTGEPLKQSLVQFGSAATVTRNEKTLPSVLIGVFDAEAVYGVIDRFMLKYEGLYSSAREDLYRTYMIPKSNGKMRRIDEPCVELNSALWEMEKILLYRFGAMYHTSAFAYVKNRSTKDCLEKHARSNWFMKTDFHDFFGSTTLDTIMNSLSLIYPFCMYFEKEEHKSQFRAFIELALFNGGLPQGTMISPMLTNLVMIPFDYSMNIECRKHGIIYTRYADDCLFSSEKKFDMNWVRRRIIGTLRELRFPYRLNDEKTRFGSVNGKNWNLGLMLNGTHAITIGHENKRKLKADIWSFLNAYWGRRRADENALKWKNREAVQTFAGRLNYYAYIEPEYVDTLIRRTAKKISRWWWIDMKKMNKSVIPYILRYYCQ